MNNKNSNRNSNNNSNKNSKKPQTKKDQINKRTSNTSTLSPNSYNAFNPFINPHDTYAAHSAQTTHSHNPFMTNTSSHSSHSSSPSNPYSLYNNEYHQIPHTNIDDFFDSDLYDPDWEECFEGIEDYDYDYCNLQNCDTCPQKKLCDELQEEYYKHAEFIRTALTPTDNPLSFQYYGLNPMKNFLYKHIGETFTAEYKKEYNLNPTHSKAVPFTGEITKILQGKIAELLVSESYAVFDDIEANSIFVVTLNKDHLIFEMSYDEETETGGLSVDIYEGEEEYPCFACYDLTDYPSGYGLIIEIEPNVWKIV